MNETQTELKKVLKETHIDILLSVGIVKVCEYTYLHTRNVYIKKKIIIKIPRKINMSIMLRIMIKINKETN